jgi:hypothetical protein
VSIYLPACLSVCLSIYLPIYLSIYDSTALVDLGRFFNLLIYTQSIGWGISSSQGRYLHTGQHKQRKNTQTDIHASSGIRNHDPSVRAGEDNSYLRPRGHCDRLHICLLGAFAATLRGGACYPSVTTMMRVSWRKGIFALFIYN